MVTGSASAVSASAVSTSANASATLFDIPCLFQVPFCKFHKGHYEVYREMVQARRRRRIDMVHSESGDSFEGDIDRVVVLRTTHRKHKELHFVLQSCRDVVEKAR